VVKVKCPLCKKDITNLFDALPGYSLARCKFCNFVFDYQPKCKLLEHYKKDYFVNKKTKGGYANYFEGMRLNSRTFAMRLARIKKKVGVDVKLLDVGCALGDCMKEAKKMGFSEVFGIDPSSYAIATAKKQKLNAKTGTLKTVNFKSNSFDVILSQDQIEHVVDPLEELKRMNRLTSFGGIVFIVTPDVDGLFARVLKRYWYHYKPVEHVSYFSKDTLRDALKKAGFKNIVVKPTNHIMTLEYIFNRLSYYSPKLFGQLGTWVNKLGLDQKPIKIYTGEIEAWGQK